MTINYGLRWEIYFPETVNAKGNGGFAKSSINGTGGIRVAGFGNIRPERQCRQQLQSFCSALRYRVPADAKTVVRMGYGRSYDIGVFGSNFGHTVTQNLPVLLKQNCGCDRFQSGCFRELMFPYSFWTDGPVAAAFPRQFLTDGFIPFSALGGQIVWHAHPSDQAGAADGGCVERDGAAPDHQHPFSGSRIRGQQRHAWLRGRRSELRCEPGFR